MSSPPTTSSRAVDFQNTNEQLAEKMTDEEKEREEKQKVTEEARNKKKGKTDWRVLTLAQITVAQLIVVCLQFVQCVEEAKKKRRSLGNVPIPLALRSLFAVFWRDYAQSAQTHGADGDDEPEPGHPEDEPEPTRRYPRRHQKKLTAEQTSAREKMAKGAEKKKTAASLVIGHCFCAKSYVDQYGTADDRKTLDSLLADHAATDPTSEVSANRSESPEKDVPGSSGLVYDDMAGRKNNAGRSESGSGTEKRGSEAGNESGPERVSPMTDVRRVNDGSLKNQTELEVQKDRTMRTGAGSSGKKDEPAVYSGDVQDVQKDKTNKVISGKVVPLIGGVTGTSEEAGHGTVSPMTVNDENLEIQAELGIREDQTMITEKSRSGASKKSDEAVDMESVTRKDVVVVQVFPENNHILIEDNEDVSGERAESGTGTGTGALRTEASIGGGDKVGKASGTAGIPEPSLKLNSKSLEEQNKSQLVVAKDQIVNKSAMSEEGMDSGTGADTGTLTLMTTETSIICGSETGKVSASGTVSKEATLQNRNVTDLVVEKKQTMRAGKRNELESEASTSASSGKTSGSLFPGNKDTETGNQKNLDNQGVENRSGPASEQQEMNDQVEESEVQLLKTVPGNGNELIDRKPEGLTLHLGLSATSARNAPLPSNTLNQTDNLRKRWGYSEVEALPKKTSRRGAGPEQLSFASDVFSILNAKSHPGESDKSTIITNLSLIGVSTTSEHEILPANPLNTTMFVGSVKTINFRASAKLCRQLKAMIHDKDYPRKVLEQNILKFGAQTGDFMQIGVNMSSAALATATFVKICSDQLQNHHLNYRICNSLCAIYIVKPFGSRIEMTLKAIFDEYPFIAKSAFWSISSAGRYALRQTLICHGVPVQMLQRPLN